MSEDPMAEEPENAEGSEDAEEPEDGAERGPMFSGQPLAAHKLLPLEKIPPVDRTRRPPPSPPLGLTVPEFQERCLGNGVIIECAHRPNIPEVAIQMILEAGAESEDSGSAGLAELTASLVTEGSGEMGAMEMAERLDYLGADFRVGADYAVTSASLHCLPDMLRDALNFMGDCVIHPSFPPSEFTRVRQEHLDGIAMRLDDPASAAMISLLPAIYGTGRYAVSVQGAAASVGALTRDDAERFHRGRYSPSGARIVACGGVEPEKLLDLMEERFGDWTGEDLAPAPPPVSPDPVRREGVILLERPGAAQAEVRIGAVGVAYGTDDHFALVLANALLGGLFNSRINMNLREEKGWTYGARTSFSFRRGPGPFLAAAAVESRFAGPALEEMLGEIHRMASEPVPDDELTLARNALTLSLPRTFETAGQMVAAVSRQRVFGLSPDYWTDYSDQMESVTPEQVMDAVRGRLDPKALVLLVAGDPASTGGLGQLGPVTRLMPDCANFGAAGAAPPAFGKES